MVKLCGWFIKLYKKNNINVSEYLPEQAKSEGCIKTILSLDGVRVDDVCYLQKKNIIF